MENIQFTREPFTVIDQMSDTEIYVGTSIQFKDMSKPMWRIKRSWKTGNIWNFGYPNGDQDFKFIWDNRLSYTYE